MSMKENTSTLDFSGKHILLVEDNELNAEIGIRTFKILLKVIIDLAKNGEECIKNIRKDIKISLCMRIMFSKLLWRKKL